MSRAAMNGVRGVVWSLVAVGGLAACGPLSYTVDRELLRDVSVENKLILFDAENDVSIALDERENLRRQIMDLRQDIRDAEAQILEANSDRDRYSEKGDQERVGVSELAVDVYELKIDWLEERISLARERLSMQDRLIMVAAAKYELAKAKLVKNYNVRGAADLELVDYEAQVDAQVEQAKSSQADLTEAEAVVAEAEKVWQAKREELRKASGGGQGTAWADDGDLWGK